MDSVTHNNENRLSFAEKQQLLVSLSKLELKCDEIKSENERMFNHTFQVKKLILKYKSQRKLLITKLEKHKFNFDDCKYPLFNEEETNIDTNGEVNSDKTSKSWQSNTNNVIKVNPANRLKKVKLEPKSEQRETGPTPKKPINPYLLFCQENRSTIQEKYFQQNNSEMSNQELTKALAQNWHDLSSDDKQVYYDLYEQEKERYETEMKAYTAANNSLE
ncbi:SWI/SNF-related matrix-associated actin-dependent regulator of chromatin subfamily E member 1-like protein [Leptotrombidium deliense]|uniref:SWI/SNF-related matrix-associated actin-dependent regulator of chromatin subfamily E member 1-like protein n=1 Tax=Leptotrombidium deliense TaxID=299467 RepID=A0A443SPT3_9ACAR|nr:SWI/SNF-related matrix-associated actin-dependent regulator of chromatin subfamily E member 1-like protein [Leptotrombidium deliense]